jgi:uncharacterized protein YukE
MPGWNPNWQDVRFNYAAAAEYVETCRTTANGMEMWQKGRDRNARTARRDWGGPHRDTFDHERREINRQTEQLIDELRQSERSVRRAAEAARGEQLQREWDRSRWNREAEAERRAEEQRRAGLERCAQLEREAQQGREADYNRQAERDRCAAAEAQERERQRRMAQYFPGLAA